MAKYKVGDEFKHKEGEDTVKSKIIFVPPLDGYGIQYYLEEIYSLYANGGEKQFYHLQREEELDKYFVLR